MLRPSIALLLTALAAAASSAEAGDAAVPAAVPNLDALVALALERHPALEARRVEAASIRESGDAAGALPEPMVTVAPLGDMAQTAAGEVQAMFGVSQRLPGPGKLDAMVAARRSRAGLTEASERAEAVAIARSLRTAWWRRSEALRAEELVRAQQFLIEELHETVAARVEANLASSGKLLRLGVEAGSLDARLSELRREAATAAADMRRLLALAPTDAIPALETAPSPLDIDATALAIAAESGHPELRRSDAQARIAAAEARLAAVRGRPDFTIFANYNLVDDEGLAPMANGDDQWWVGFGVSVPLWGGSYSAGERAAEFDARSASLRRLAARDTIASDLAASRAAWEAAAAQRALYAERLVPTGEQALAAERASYAAGEGAFSDLVMSARQLLDLRLALLGYEHRLGRIAAELLAAAGLVAEAEIEEVDDE